jgi:hypothetical protein
MGGTMAKLKRGEFQPSQDQKLLTLHDSVWYEIVFAFGIPAHDPTDYCTWETLNFTRMGHARVLYTFFEATLDKRYEDDVLSEDYGFGAAPVDLPEDDRLRLNKDLFHMTYARLRHTPETKPWPSTILANLHSRSVDFIRHILEQRDYFRDDAELPRWTGLLEHLISGRELLISATVGPEGRSTYRFGLGAPLPNGQPALTSLLAVASVG